ncbi:MAG: hypothetical protein ACR2RB_11730 [Gammaproteobacteria bacterium]
MSLPDDIINKVFQFGVPTVLVFGMGILLWQVYQRLSDDVHATLQVIASQEVRQSIALERIAAELRQSKTALFYGPPEPARYQPMYKQEPGDDRDVLYGP